MVMYGRSVADALELLRHCDGLLLTGGEDIHPAFYGKIADTSICGKINGYRDTLELGLLTEAMKQKIPVLGICRGEQIICVGNKGTLVTDIPTAVPGHVTHNTLNSVKAFHKVTPVSGTRLSALVGLSAGTVNSFHHQCAERIPTGFQVTARADDGVVEGIESNPGTVFMMGVQWHPERLDYESPFSAGIATGFLDAVLKK